MATVKSVTKIHDARFADGKVHVNYRVEFEELENSPTDVIGAVDPETSLAVPYGDHSVTWEVPADPDPIEFTGYLSRFEVQQINPLVYKVMLEYDPDVSQDTEPNSSGNWSIDFSVRSVPVVVEVSKDRDGAVMSNSAGEPYRGIKRIRYDREYTVTWKTNNPATIIAAIDTCLGKVNNAACAFTINGITRTFGSAGVLKLVDAQYHTVKTRPLVSEVATEWDISLVLLHRADTWIETVVDEGTYYLDGDSNPVPAPLGGTLLLDGAGGQLEEGDPVEFNTFWLDGEADFSALFSGL